MDAGEEMLGWAKDLFPICRSLTGTGVRETLDYLRNLLPNMTIHEVPSGTQAFDWTVPNEWNIDDAFVMDVHGNKIIDFKKNNLHVVGYSEPVSCRIPFIELDHHLHSLPDLPQAVPYVTSYYERRWGFCISENQRNNLRQQPDALFDVRIDSSLEAGSLTYGELLIPGTTDQEVLLSTYVCHPSMANNELSGPCVTTALARWLETKSDRRFSYRVVFVPETIGSIVYLSRHVTEMKNKTLAGYVITCVGDERCYSYLASRHGNTLSDRAARHVLNNLDPTFKSYTFLDRGSDERQYCSPGIDLPIGSVMRSKYGTFPEYHTSLDDLSLISARGLEGAFNALQQCIGVIEANKTYRATVLGEPQLGKRELYPSLSTNGTRDAVRALTDFLAYADGTNDLLAIADKIDVSVTKLTEVAETLYCHGLIQIVD